MFHNNHNYWRKKAMKEGEWGAGDSPYLLICCLAEGIGHWLSSSHKGWGSVAVFVGVILSFCKTNW
jgi:hypothetical protein